MDAIDWFFYVAIMGLFWLNIVYGLNEVFSKFSKDEKYIDRAVSEDLPIKLSRIEKIVVKNDADSKGNNLLCVYAQIKDYKELLNLYRLYDTEENKRRINAFISMIENKKSNLEKMNEMFKNS